MWSLFETAGLLLEDFATTSIMLDDDKSVKSTMCTGCTGFADSILYLHDTQRNAGVPDTSGWCVHTCCVASVLQTLSNKSTTNSFTCFVAAQSKLTQKVTVIRETANTAKYLVFTDEDAAYESGVPTFSLCVIRRNHNQKFVTCRDVRCKRGKTKRMENITKISQVCCHLQELLTHLKVASLENSDIIDDLSDNDSVGEYKVISRLFQGCFIMLFQGLFQGQFQG